MPESFCELSNLEHLTLCGCTQLQRSPRSFGRVGKLKVLDLRETGLEELPEDLGQLQNLTEIYFTDCKQLQDLGESFGCLGNLRELSLRGCSSLVQLPESFTSLFSLESLDLRDCKLCHAYPYCTERLTVVR